MVWGAPYSIIALEFIPGLLKTVVLPIVITVSILQ